MSVSIYTKEELPTWNELYYEFYQKYPIYMTSDLGIDPYYKIPRNRVLLALAYNQLNKMLMENKTIRDKITSYIINDMEHCDCLIKDPGYQFIALDTVKLMIPFGKPEEQIDFGDYIRNFITHEDSSGTKIWNYIYTIPHPTGKPDPFIILDDNVKRINIMDLSDMYEFQLVVYVPKIKWEEKSYHPVAVMNPSCDITRKIIDIILDDVIQYFKKPVGWKDNEGNLIPSKQNEINCNGSGFDPAL